MRHSILFRGRLILVRALVVALAGAFALSACKGGEGAADAKTTEETPAEEAVPVEVAAASLRAVAASYTGTAPLEALGESQVVAKTSGVALQVMVEEGDVVRAGQTLVRLDADRARLQAAQTAAQVAKLQNNYQRSSQLAEQQLLSANDNDQIKYDLANARAANRLANLEVSYASVTAPISGVVASRSIKTGNFVQINTPIFRIVDTSQLEAVLKAGLPVELTVDSLPGQTFTGRVDRVAPVVDAGSGTFRVICAFEGGGLLQPGMFGRISIAYDQRANALTVPRIALLDGEGDPAVFVVRESKAVRVPVKLGYVDGQWVEVREGLKTGDQVVVAGKAALREGSLVQVVGQPKATQVAAAKPAAAKAEDNDDNQQ